MHYVIAILCVIVLMLSVSPALPYGKGTVDVEIISDKGDVFSVIPFKDFRTGCTHVIKKYLEAKRGKNYSIVIRNNMNERIGVVIAVDGRNIITGKKSFLKDNEMMYIIGPYGYSRLEGWRTDEDTVHQFYFTDIRDSYAVKTFRDTSAMGVIAVAVFREKEKPRILYERQTQKEKAPGAPQSPARSESKRYESDTAGTGFGDEKYSPGCAQES